ncbi:hypothetical protein ACFLSA_00100 [Bacteroidota bacterium]
MIKFKCLVSMLFIAFSISVNSQEKTSVNRVISFVPQYIIKKGIRVDFERDLAGSNRLLLGPQLYLSEKNNSDDYYIDEDEYNLLFGAGIVALVKNFRNNPEELGLYLGYGVRYNFFSIKYDELDSEGRYEVNSTIHKTGVDLILGHQMLFFDFLSIDMYTGFGIRYSLFNTEGESVDKFNSGVLDYNATGNVLLLGLRIGLKY